MVGQFGRERGLRELVRIDVGLDEGGCLLPNGIVAAHENNAPAHQRRYRIILNGERSHRILVVRGVGSRRLLLDDQRIGLELLSGQSGELILVPHGLVVERKMRRTVRNRYSEEIRMFERPYLSIERVADQAQPWN